MKPLDLLDCLCTNTGQGVVGILCCKDLSSLTYICQKGPALSLQGCMWPVSPQPVLLFEAAPGLMQDFAFGFVEFHEVSTFFYSVNSSSASSASAAPCKLISVTTVFTI